MKRLFITAMLLLMGLSMSACSGNGLAGANGAATYTYSSIEVVDVPRFDGYYYF